MRTTRGGTPLLVAACFVLLTGCASGSRQATPTTADPWTALRRPLASPAVPAGTCPTGSPRAVNPAFGPAIGDGPVFAVLGSGVLYAASAGMYKTLWVADPIYQGPVLIRGQQLDGNAGVAFQVGVPGTPIPEMRLQQSGATAPSDLGWRQWPSLSILPGPGCYAIQVDGQTFTETVIVQVVA